MLRAIVIALFTGFFVFASIIANAQRGKIIKAGDPIMDPNQDGFVSKDATGFSSRQYNVPEFEIKMFGIPKAGGDATGDNVGKSCGITDLIPDSLGYSVYAIRDAGNNLIFRFRVGDDNPSVESWSILLDTDGLFGANDPNTSAGNPGFEIAISLIKNSNKGVFVYNIDGLETCPTEVLNYPFSTHFQISIADEATCGGPDYFYDFYVPFSDVANAFGIDLNTGLKYAAVSNTSATCPMSGKISDVSGVNDNDYNGCYACMFTALMDGQCSTPIINLCPTCNGFSADVVHAPSIHLPLISGQQSVSGSTVESNIFIVLKVFTNIAPVGSPPAWGSSPREQHGVYAVGTNWQITLDGPLQPFDRIVASAQMDQNSVPCGADGGGNQTTTSVTVVQPNTPPVANNQTVTLLEDTPSAITLTGSDVDGQPITFTVLSPPTHGTLSGSAPNLNYTPALNYNGSDFFTFRVSDGTANSNIATASITIAPINDVPIANSQSVSLPEDGSIPITLAGTDAEGSSLTYTVVTPPSHGTLTGSAPNLTYTPALNYNGLDNFTFKVNDGTVDSNVGTVSITVTPVNDAPVANNQTKTLPEDGSVAITLTGSDVDGTALTYTIVTPPAHGTLTGSAPNITYAPALNYNGTDGFTFKVNDGTVDSNIGTVSITITAVNDAPIAVSQAVSLAEDSSLPITLAGTDVDGNPITYIVVSPPLHGTLSGVAPNLTYTPALNYHGLDNFGFKVNDGSVDSNIAGVSITVTSVNDAPLAANQSVSLPEDGSIAITLMASDVDADALTFTIVSPPAHGTLTGTAPNLIYKPALFYHGADAFTFKVNDGTVDSNNGTVSITVTHVNHPPIANDQNANYVMNVAKGIILSAVDVDGDALTFTITTPPAHGTLTGVAPNVTYTPNLNYTGGDSFAFKVNDGSVDSNIGTVSLSSITGPNNAPVADDQPVSLPEDGSAAITLTGSDLDGNALSYAIVAPPAHGTLSGAAPNLTYTPVQDYNGPDIFTFKVNDGTTDSNIGTITITVTAVNDSPIASNQGVSLLEDGSIPITLTGSDVDGNPLTFTVVSPPSHGALTGAAPNLTYTPTANYNGLDNFTFKVNDGTVDSNVGTVSITVTPGNDAPVANDLSTSLAEDGSVSLTLTGSDLDGNSLTYVIVTPPAHGTLTGSAPNLTYDPALNFNGADAFTFKVNDGTVDSNIGTVSIAVTAVNDAPIANGQTVTVAEDGALPITLTGTDVDGNPLTYSVVTPPTHGALSGAVPNLTYTPVANFHGLDNFTFKVNDGTVDSNVGGISLTVTPVNDAPLAVNQSVGLDENVATPITLQGTDIDGDALTYAIATPPAHGTLTGTAPNVTYIPTSFYFGADGFTFTVNDGTVSSVAATVTILVNFINHAPVANDQSVTLLENAITPITLTGSDVDGNALAYTVLSQPIHGTLTGAAPNLIYTPVSYYFGPDTFTFKDNDGTVDSNTGTVSITVTYVNHAPVVNTLPIVYTQEDSARLICPNVADEDGDPIVFGQPVNTLGGGTMVKAASPYDFCYTFAPSLNLNGRSLWTFQLCDPGGLCVGGAVEIIINPVNDTPQALNDEIFLKARETSSFNILSNDLAIAAPYSEFYDIFATDPAYTDSLTLDTTPLFGPYHGSVLMDSSGTVTYTPVFDFFGSDSINYRMCDSGKLCSTATVFIDVARPAFKVYEGLSPNGDGKNDYWRIDGIESFPDNSVEIFDRFNNLVFKIAHYDNEGNRWTGQANHGAVRGTVPEGTYYYSLNLGDGNQPVSGFVILKQQ